MRLFLTTLTLTAGSMVLGQTAAPPAKQQSEGVRPRASASEYAAQAKNATAVLAATVLPPDQVKQRFAFDISKQYLVMEVACYPEAQRSVDLQGSNFRINAVSKGEVEAAEASTVAAQVQSKHVPTGGGQTPVYSEVSVGYEHGTDPYTGRRVNNVYTEAGVAVGQPPYGPYPSSSPIDQSLLEDQLWHRSLPEGAAAKPVAGYLYFPIALLKKEKGFYLVQVVGEGQDRWELRVPTARR